MKIFLTQTDGYLNADAFAYLVKTKEIILGDWRPIKSHSFGLSIVSSIFLFPFIDKNYVDLAYYAKLLNIFYNSIILFPMFLISKQLNFSKLAIFISILIFIFYPTYYQPQQFMTENLFTFIFLFILFFVLKYQETNKNLNLLILFILIALSYYIKPTGLILYISIIIYLCIFNIKKLYNLISIILFSSIFWIASLPFLFHRYIYFGSPFTYGNNDKYFLETYTYVWSDNISNINLFEFLLSTPMIEIIDKFIKNGLMKIFFDLFIPISNSLNIYSMVTSPIILIFFLVVFLNNLFKVKFSIFIYSFIFWIFPLSLVYEIYGTPRHLYFLIPIIILLSSEGLDKFLKFYKSTKLTNISLLLFFIIFQTINPFYLKYFTGYKEHDTRYIEWIIDNKIDGNFATIGGDHVLMMYFYNSKVALKDAYNLYDPVHNIYLSPIGYFKNENEAMQYYNDKKINYLLIYEPSHWRVKVRPFLSDMLKNKNGILKFNKIFPVDDKYSEKHVYKVIY